MLLKVATNTWQQKSFKCYYKKSKLKVYIEIDVLAPFYVLKKEEYLEEIKINGES